jgi:hypothetical protein
VWPTGGGGRRLASASRVARQRPQTPRPRRKECSHSRRRERRSPLRTGPPLPCHRSTTAISYTGDGSTASRSPEGRPAVRSTPATTGRVSAGPDTGRTAASMPMTTVRRARCPCSSEDVRGNSRLSPKTRDWMWHLRASRRSTHGASMTNPATCRGGPDAPRTRARPSRWRRYHLQVSRIATRSRSTSAREGPWWPTLAADWWLASSARKMPAVPDSAPGTGSPLPVTALVDGSVANGVGGSLRGFGSEKRRQVLSDLPDSAL